MQQIQVNGALLRLAGGQAHCAAFQAVVNGVAQHMLQRRDDALDWGGETLAMATIFGLTYLVMLPLTRALRTARAIRDTAR